MTTEMACGRLPGYPALPTIIRLPIVISCPGPSFHPFLLARVSAWLRCQPKGGTLPASHVGEEGFCVSDHFPDHVTVEMSVRVKGHNIVSANFTIYDCSRIGQVYPHTA